PAEPPQRRERSGWNPMGSPATYALTAINIGVFVVMVMHHVSPTMPSSDDLVRWGANLGWADYNGTAQRLIGDQVVAGAFRGQWWRLVTATFEHVGAI